jgi:pantoate--beta-alanine ligase
VTILCRTIAQARRARATLGEGKLALVPTMGALHAGHRALIRAASQRASHVAVSIFVNPTQFGPSEDFASYPRQETTDRETLEDERVALLFAPEAPEIYPAGFATRIEVAGLGNHLCGPFRPGHFSGVATIVTKLIDIISPELAVFGEKDFQQLRIVSQVTRDLDLATDIVGIPTVREADGLALSSRNAYLSDSERRTAAQLPRALKEAARVMAEGIPAAPVIQEVERALVEAGFGPIDYVTLASSETLTPLDRAVTPCRLFAAAYLGRTRLIDNWPVL